LFEICGKNINVVLNKIIVKEVETIIVGGGISGLSCAKTLFENGKDFILLSDQIGGRMLASKTFSADYGAAYVTSQYKNVLKYVDKNNKLNISDYYFFDGNGFSTIFHYRHWKRIPNILRFFFYSKLVAMKLTKAFNKMKYREFRDCVNEDPDLKYYWNTSAEKFLREKKFTSLNDFYGNAVCQSTLFAESKQLSALYYLSVAFPAILSAWQVNLKKTIKKLSYAYRSKIIISKVRKMKKRANLFIVQTEKGKFFCKNVVLALPYRSAIKICDKVPRPKLLESIFVFHIVGRRKDFLKEKPIVFLRPGHYDINILWKQSKGSDIIYSKHPKPDFKQYYEIYHIVKKVHWEHAITIPGKELIRQKLDTNLYLASDYNLSGLEYCYLTGVFAANQIISKKDNSI